jgi:type I restriction enzyme M protein
LLAQSANVAPEWTQRIWQAADAVREHMDAGEYKHVVLGLIFLRYVNDAFERRRSPPDAHTEQPDVARRWSVPPEARWSYLVSRAGQSDIGHIVDDAMAAIERDNPIVEGALPKEYGRPGLDAQRVGRLIALLDDPGPVNVTTPPEHVFGRLYESLLALFARAEVLRGDAVRTPPCVAQVLVELVAPRAGRLYDPCCGAGGLLVEARRFLERRGHNGGAISVHGQEASHATWRLARMNCALHAIDAHIAHGDSLRADAFADLRADYVLADPPFNARAWQDEASADDRRWAFGTPPAGNANFAWVQHVVQHMAPAGLAGMVLPNNSMWSRHGGESAIRRAIVEADLVDAVVALPGQMFDSTSIPACLWLLARDKRHGRFRARSAEVLLIDARALGVMRDRRQRELTGEEIHRLADTYHAWRGDPDAPATYADVPGFCRATTLGEIARHDHVLTPGRYVGAEPVLDDEEPFDIKIQRLGATLRAELDEARRLDEVIRRNLDSLGYGGDRPGRR